MSSILGSSLRTALVVTSVLALAGACSAAVVFTEDFESFTDNTNLPSTGNYPWQVPASATSAPNSTQTRSTAQSPFTAGTLGLRIFDGETLSGNSSPAPILNFHLVSPSVNTGVSANYPLLQWSFDFNLGDAAPINYGVRLNGPGGSSEVGPGITLDRTNTGEVYLRSNNAFYPSGTTPAVVLSSNTWYHASAIVDMVNRTYTAAITNGLTTWNLTPSGPIAFEDNVTTLTQMQFADGSSTLQGNDIMFDNLRLESVPEIGSLSLLASAFAAMGLVLRNRRNRS